MNIVYPEIAFDGELVPLRLEMVDSIALHDSEQAEGDVYDVDQWFKRRGYSGIGYNYFIHSDGTVIEGRGLNTGDAVKYHDGHVLSVAFQGNFTHSLSMPAAQYRSGVRLIQYLMNHIPTITMVDGHSHWAGTDCPGRYFPLGEMIADSTTKTKS
ncbi:peptidoglycan recognition protein family protein [Feifania hominis]|uniref:N-acetylmuramoyl-L-alanine amidase n=1 Tax=Feifania hominis TaxID=2763660 RepID=A0A926HTC0_9FIRM|nr:peptidoglycan recognition family protein [Feifania hominis]MBC8535714.1 N-acetylmuramoyl-L-alanine amidase [Feifania hominis]